MQVAKMLKEHNKYFITNNTADKTMQLRKVLVPSATEMKKYKLHSLMQEVSDTPSNLGVFLPFKLAKPFQEKISIKGRFFNEATIGEEILIEPSHKLMVSVVAPDHFEGDIYMLYEFKANAVVEENEADAETGAEEETTEEN